MNEDIYPVLIMKARYGGIYEGAEWFALNADYKEVSDCDSSDVPCSIFFSNITSIKDVSSLSNGILNVILLR